MKKRMMLIVLTAVLCAGLCFSFNVKVSAASGSDEAIKQGINYGDADFNGYVTISDVVLLQRIISQFNIDFPFSISNEMVLKACDVNKNHKIEIDDVTVIQRYLADFDNSTRICNSYALTWGEIQPYIDAAVPLDAWNKEIEFSPVKPLVLSYLTETKYNPDNYKVSYVADYCKESRLFLPLGYSLTLPENANRIILYDTQSKKGLSYYLSGNTTFDIQNLIPHRSYRYTVFDGSSNILDTGSIRANDDLRMIATKSCANVRDLGGWKADGGTVNYGKIFRGSTFANKDEITISESDKSTMKNVLKIKTELDFQLLDEGGVRTGSALGDEIDYYPIPSSAYYLNMVDLSKNTSVIKSALLKTFESVNNGLPLYFHCYYGADRTGTLAFVLESLLGMSESDIDKEYELTSFSGFRKKRNNSNYKAMVSYFKSFGKNNRRDNVVKWALDLGISLDDINSFRACMIDGSPQQLSMSMYQ